MNVELLAKTYAIIAEIEGMKAENMQREACGSSMAYGGSSFFDESKNLLVMSEKQKGVVNDSIASYINGSERKGQVGIIKGFFQYSNQDGDAFPVVLMQFEDGKLVDIVANEVTILK